MIKDVFRQVLSDLEAICSGNYPGEVEKAVELIVKAFRNRKKLLVFGNGGSAADAQHICGEFVGRYLKERAALPAIALSANQVTLTAVANDYGFAKVFSRQIEAFASPGDIAWGISTSGKSPNIIEGLKAAKGRSLATIGLTGSNREQMAPWCDVLLAVPSSFTPRIQEMHVITYHSICARVEEQLSE